MKNISALIYLLGCLALICGGVWTVMMILTQVADNYGPGFGLGALVLCIFLSYGYRHVVGIPFVAWAALWAHWDARIK